jgi:hypothetical protein
MIMKNFLLLAAFSAWYQKPLLIGHLLLAAKESKEPPSQS